MKRFMKYSMLMGVIISGFYFVIDAQDGHMKLLSSEFKNGEKLPKKYSCEGDDVNPPLAWQNVPAQAKSLALIVDDPDAPNGTWVHWVLFNVPVSVNKLDENLSIATLNGAQQGMNSSNQLKFQGACPPRGHGVHHYHFTLYALDSMLDLKKGITKEDLLSAIDGHIITKAQLVATYERK